MDGDLQGPGRQPQDPWSVWSHSSKSRARCGRLEVRTSHHSPQHSTNRTKANRMKVEVPSLKHTVPWAFPSASQSTGSDSGRSHHYPTRAPRPCLGPTSPLGCRPPSGHQLHVTRGHSPTSGALMKLSTHPFSTSSNVRHVLRLEVDSNGDCGPSIRTSVPLATEIVHPDTADTRQKSRIQGPTRCITDTLNYPRTNRMFLCAQPVNASVRGMSYDAAFHVLDLGCQHTRAMPT